MALIPGTNIEQTELQEPVQAPTSQTGIIANAINEAQATQPAASALTEGPVNPLLATANQATAAPAFTPEQVAFDPATATVAGQLEDLTSRDSKFIQTARTGAAKTANRRGLLNTSIAAGAGEEAAIRQALPIAAADAAAMQRQEELNVGAANVAGMQQFQGNQQLQQIAATGRQALEQIQASGDQQAYQTALKGQQALEQIAASGTVQQAMQYMDGQQSLEQLKASGDNAAYIEALRGQNTLDSLVMRGDIDMAMQLQGGRQSLEQIRVSGDVTAYNNALKSQQIMEQIAMSGDLDTAAQLLDGQQRINQLLASGDIDAAQSVLDRNHELEIAAFQGDLQSQLLADQAYWDSEMLSTRYEFESDMLADKTASQMELVGLDYQNQLQFNEITNEQATIMQELVSGTELQLRQMLNSNSLLIQGSKNSGNYAALLLQSVSNILISDDIPIENKQEQIDKLMAESQNTESYLAAITGSGSPTQEDTTAGLLPGETQVPLPGTVIPGSTYVAPTTSTGAVVSYNDYTPAQQDALQAEIDRAIDQSAADFADSTSTDKIACTAMNKQYGFGGFRQTIWLEYSKTHLEPEHETGYHFIFKPVLKYCYEDNRMGYLYVRAIIEHIAKRRTRDIRSELRGSKRSIIDRIERGILEPLCLLVGRIIKKLEK